MTASNPPGQPFYDSPRHLEYARGVLLPGEHLIAVVTAMRGFVAITSRRFISQENANKNEFTMVSIPFGRISSVALFVTQRGTRLGVEVGERTYFIEFTTADAARYVHDQLVDRISPDPGVP